MNHSRRAFVPAAGHDWFLPLYDPFVKLLGGDAARRELVEQAALDPGQRVLDIGCGTGTLALLIKRLHLAVEVVGLDPDPKALARARRKAERAGIPIRFDQGFSDDLPCSDASFDRVFSSFMLHHLEGPEKQQTLREVRRVLRPGGSLHLLDFGGPKSSADRSLTRWFHFHDRLKENFDGGILRLIVEAGFAEARENSHRRMLLGQIAYYRASVPAAEQRSG